MAMLYASKERILYTFGTFFISFTNCRWMNLIDESIGYDVIYRWYDYLKREGNFLHGYVIMPNHVHKSAKFYITDAEGIYPVTHVGELRKIKLVQNEWR